MTATTMHFGPEWMRTKQAPSRLNPSPPLNSPAPVGTSSYSALVTPVSQSQPEKRDLSNPFSYSKEDIIRIYKEGGGKGGLGLEVEKWEGIVREVGSDPVGLKEMSEAEKKIFSGPLNSEMRRRPSTDYLSLSTAGLGDRPKLGHTASGQSSPLRERIGGFMGRRRDSTDQPPLSLPRKLSQSSLQAPLVSPREALPSPRTRIGGATGFDGVLSDSWTSRRRASEGIKPGGRLGEAGDGHSELKDPGIKEEDEELRADIGGSTDEGPQKEYMNSGTSQTSSGGVHQGSAQPGTDSISGGVSNLSLNTAGSAAPLNMSNQPEPLGPPPGIVDLNMIEWSYLDPQGQVQGPFPAGTMQKWHDEGYFTPNLLMKRTHIDTEWISVGELINRAGNPRPFLTALTTASPAIPSRLEAQTPDREPSAFGSPFQPVPTRSLRTTALESYLHNSSTPGSPASTFSAGRFSNGSPDPTALGRIGAHLYDSPAGPRLASLGIQGEPQRRTTYDESFDPAFGARQPYGTTRGASLDNFGYAGTDISPSLFDPAFAQGGFGANGHNPSQGFGGQDYNATGYPREISRLLPRELYSERSDPQTLNQFGNGLESGGHQFNQTSAYGISGQPISERQPIVQQRNIQQTFATSPTVSSHWSSQEIPGLRRPGPFDAEHPTAQNTTTIRTLTPSQMARTPSSSINGQSSWFNHTASPVVSNDGWRTDPSSLTTSNLVRHDKQQEQQPHQQAQLDSQPTLADSPELPKKVPAEKCAPETSQSVQKELPTPTPAAEPAAPTQKPKSRKASVPAIVNVLPEPKANAPPSPVASIPEVKTPAWATPDDKAKPATPLGFREIQEMETKKQEARKAAERERVARATAQTSPSVEEVQTFTASWGLPTSQAGSRSNHNSATPKEPSVVTSASTTAPAVATPVWTTAPKAAVKKSMKEIQEEEEKRKKIAAKEKETIAAAARRAHTETTNKQPPPPTTTGGAWTTVGASGKVTPAVAAPPRPTISTTPAPKVVPGAAPPTAAAAVRNAATPTRSPVVTAAMKLAPPPRAEETSVAPSHEFLKWLTEALSGLNKSVNLEEITSMLLSFPVDPDASTTEIICDLIYANSTTLDGRRFAAEYVSKRKADAKGSASTAPVGKPMSIAEVVKTQPKPATNEWGSFKVVNKKKKGTRN